MSRIWVPPVLDEEAPKQFHFAEAIIEIPETGEALYQGIGISRRPLLSLGFIKSSWSILLDALRA